MPDHNSSPSSDYRALLFEIASRKNIEDGYWDIWGRRHETTDEVRRAILASLGVDTTSEATLRRALLRMEQETWGRLAPTTWVACASSQPLVIDIRLPAHPADAILEAALVLEDGHRMQWQVPSSSCAQKEEIQINGTGYVRRELTIPESLPLGYHRLQLRALDSANPASQTHLILCPDRAWLPPALQQGQRSAGLAVSLYGLRGEATWGCGDFTALRSLIDWVASELHGNYIALNPLHAIHNRQPYNTSPYLPNTFFYRNSIYLDITAIDEMKTSSWGRTLLSNARIQEEIRALNQSELVEYERVHKLKLRFLKALFRAFLHHHWRHDTPRARQFRSWAEAEGDLLDRFAIHSALDEHLHRLNPDLWIWPDWPAQYQDPRLPAIAEFAQTHWRSVLFYKYVQWQLDQQAEAAQQHAKQRGMAIGLFHDLPLATDRCGFELWANRDHYVSGCRVGAPPDDFSPKGQDWSFPPPNTDAHKADGYRLFAQSIRNSARHGGALRIDHVMRLFRLYWIPDGFDATQGTYVRDHHEDLLRILALESVRSQVLIVGEDLGTVEPSMREALSSLGILSYRLLYFERTQQGGFRLPQEYPTQALVSSTTHDLPTLAGFWSGRDIELRRELGLLPDEAAYRSRMDDRVRDKQKMAEALCACGLLDPALVEAAAQSSELSGELHNAITGFLVSTPCLLMTLNQEDLTKEPEQQNLPGTTHQYPNWRRKMRFSLEDLRQCAEARDFAAMLRHWLDKQNRAAPKPPRNSS
jgi:4-alpha-glucanotransferase